MLNPFKSATAVATPARKRLGNSITFELSGEMFNGRVVGHIANGYKVKIKGNLYPVPVDFSMVVG